MPKTHVDNTFMSGNMTMIDVMYYATSYTVSRKQMEQRLLSPRRTSAIH